MAAGAWVFFNGGKLALGRALDLSTDTFKITLHNSTYTPNAATQSAYADLTNELSTANGYTNGGATLANVTWTNTAGTEKFTSDAVVWTASGAGITAMYAVLRASGTFNTVVGPLIAYCLLDSTPQDVTASAGNPFTITPHANGYFDMS